jgi:hypothetical protein
MAGAESLVDLTDMPLWDTDAPHPLVYANERALLVSYQMSSPADDDKPQEQSSGEIVFEDVKSFVFGAPNDEALQGHRLYDLGLRFYSSYEVPNSAWIADLCIRNRVHPSH